jgi:hypothetical protein
MAMGRILEDVPDPSDCGSAVTLLVEVVVMTVVVVVVAVMMAVVVVYVCVVEDGIAESAVADVVV